MPNPRPSAEQARRFGERLRRMRRDRGLSQEGVALEADISLQHLSLLERGLSDQAKRSPANPRLGVLLHLARALDVEVTTLIEPLAAELGAEIVHSGGDDSPVEGQESTIDIAQPAEIPVARPASRSSGNRPDGRSHRT